MREREREKYQQQRQKIIRFGWAGRAASSGSKREGVYDMQNSWRFQNKLKLPKSFQFAEFVIFGCFDECYKLRLCRLCVCVFA